MHQRTLITSPLAVVAFAGACAAVAGSAAIGCSSGVAADQRALGGAGQGPDGGGLSGGGTAGHGGGGAPVTAAGGGGAGGCQNATGGPAPADHYVVLEPGTGRCSDPGQDGSGRVRDAATGLVWDRYVDYDSDVGLPQAQADAFCQGQGARLPTKTEALAISGISFDSCAWPCRWGTWTSTSAGPGLAWFVNHHGEAGPVDVGSHSTAVLCVR